MASRPRMRQALRLFDAIHICRSFVVAVMAGALAAVGTPLPAQDTPSAAPLGSPLVARLAVRGDEPVRVSEKVAGQFVATVAVNNEIQKDPKSPMKVGPGRVISLFNSAGTLLAAIETVAPGTRGGGVPPTAPPPPSPGAPTSAPPPAVPGSPLAPAPVEVRPDGVLTRTVTGDFKDISPTDVKARFKTPTAETPMETIATTDIAAVVIATNLKPEDLNGPATITASSSKEGRVLGEETIAPFQFTGAVLSPAEISSGGTADLTIQASGAPSEARVLITAEAPPGLVFREGGSRLEREMTVREVLANPVVGSVRSVEVTPGRKAYAVPVWVNPVVREDPPPESAAPPVERIGPWRDGPLVSDQPSVASRIPPETLKQVDPSRATATIDDVPAKLEVTPAGRAEITPLQPLAPGVHEVRVEAPPRGAANDTSPILMLLTTLATARPILGDAKEWVDLGKELGGEVGDALDWIKEWLGCGVPAPVYKPTKVYEEWELDVDASVRASSAAGATGDYQYVLVLYEVTVTPKYEHACSLAWGHPGNHDWGAKKDCKDKKRIREETISAGSRRRVSDGYEWFGDPSSEERLADAQKVVDKRNEELRKKGQKKAAGKGK